MKTVDYSKKSLKLPKKESLKKQCDNLWIECVKARANYSSELSGVPGKKIGGSAIITSHHIVGKSNYRLRYELENGICLENGKEHIFGVHHKFNPSVSKEYQDKIIKKITQKKYDWLLTLRGDKSKIDLHLIKIYLTQQLEIFKKSTNKRI